MKHNKPLKIIISLILILAVIWGGAFVFTLLNMPNRYEGEPLPKADEGQVRFVNDGSGTPYLAKYDDEGNMLDTSFKVITTTDFHLSENNHQLTLRLLDELVEKEKPDLVVLLGDLILSGDTENQQLIKDFFEEKELYWTFVPGNHDGQEYIATDDRYELRRWWYNSMLGSPYCISFDEGGDEVYGFGNCAVNIRTASGISQTLFFLDNSVNGDSGSAFDKSQLEWYEKRVEEIKDENGGRTVPSTVYMHRPLMEYQTAYDLVEQGGAEIVWGDIQEEIEYGGKGTEFFELAQSLGSTHTFICGHEHKNDTCIKYRGINLIYSQGLHFGEAYSRPEKIRYRLYYAINRKCEWFTEGGTGFLFTRDGKTQIVPVYLPYESYS